MSKPTLPGRGPMNMILTTAGFSPRSEESKPHIELPSLGSYNGKASHRRPGFEDQQGFLTGEPEGCGLKLHS